MKNYTAKFTFQRVLGGLFSLLGFIILNSVSESAPTLSISLLVSIESACFSPLIIPLAFFLSFVIKKSQYVLYSVIASIITAIFFGIFKAKNKSANFQIILLLAILNLIYLFFPLNNSFIMQDSKIFGALFTILFCCVSVIATNAICKKSFKSKLGLEELFSIFIVFSVFGLGVCNFFSPLVFKGIIIFTLLLSSCIFSGKEIYAFSVILATSISVYYKNISYVSLYFCIATVCSFLSEFSRFLSPIGAIFTSLILEEVFALNGGIFLSDVVCVLIACLTFVLIPKKTLNYFKDKLNSFKDKRLIKETLNRNRQAISNRLFELSNVFNEISCAFDLFNKKDLSENFSKCYLKEQIKTCACEKCKNNQNCLVNGTPDKEDLDKFVDIAFAKGKVSLIDMPKNFADGCPNPNLVLVTTNKVLAEHRKAVIDKINVKKGRELLSMQSKSVSQVLNSLAVETGAILKFKSEKEGEILDALKKRGINVSEILIFGDGENFSISAIFNGNLLPSEIIEKEISKVLNIPIKIESEYPVTNKKIYVKMSKCLDYDCIFGVYNLTKDGTSKSGDTHTVLRIDKNRLLVALSDGMGSGNKASELSSVSLSLIESFYKAGLSGDAVLQTVNKLLSINTEDCFTALDVSVIDLKDLTADFIKYGAPYGFIISKEGIRIVSGSTLPLGIIDEVKPAVAKTKLTENDVVLLLSDGVVDSFGSSSEIISFLRTLSPFNPQNMAKQVIEKAKEISDGKCKDDMTAVAVRLYKTA